MILEALKFLFELADKATVAPTPINNPSDHQVVALKEGYTLEALPRPKNNRPVRTHTIEDTGSLAEYLLRHFEPSTTEILAQPTKITAISGIGYTRDTVQCGMAAAPPFEAWSKVLGKVLNQRQAYMALNARREEILDAAAALSGFRTLEVQSKGEVKMNLMASGAVEFASTTAGMTVTGRLPEAITVRIPLYRGGPTLDLDVSIVPDLAASPPTFTFTARNLDTVKDQAFEAELARLRELLGGEAGGFLVTRGSCSIVE